MPAHRNWGWGWGSRLPHSETFEDGNQLLEQCNVRGLEGAVAKHRASIYRPAERRPG